MRRERQLLSATYFFPFLPFLDRSDFLTRGAYKNYRKTYHWVMSLAGQYKRYCAPGGLIQVLPLFQRIPAMAASNSEG
jgi:hypothetical protein